jgi:FlaA1/EpsC-like NDP-sugar epimerase
MSLRTFGTIMVASILSLSGIIFVRYRRRLVDGLISRVLAHHLDSPATRERVIIVGSGRTAEHIAWLMDHPAYSGKFQVVGFIDDDLRSQGMKIYGSKVIGRINDIPQIVQKQDVGLVILADFQTAAHKYRELENFKTARVVVVPDIFGSLSGLRGVSSEEVVIGDFSDFQCQHCVARYVASKDTSADILQIEGHA